MYGSVYANTETSSLLTVEGRRVQRVSGAGSSKTMAEGGEGEDDIQFLRTDDEVVLQSVATIKKEQRKFCLSTEGFGSRLCFLEPTSEAKYVPPDLSICVFVLEQSLSVRALQEMLTSTSEKNNEGVTIKIKH